MLRSVMLVLLAGSTAFVGCTERNRSALHRSQVGGAAPADSHVIALGNLRSGTPPSRAHIQLAEFFFGTSPSPPLGLVKPSNVLAQGERLLICDGALRAVFVWRGPLGGLDALELSPPPGRPIATADGGDGELLVVDAAAKVVHRYDAGGRERGRYATDAFDYRPAGAVRIGQEVWVSNPALHRLEVFDAESGDRLRSIGGRGDGAGEFNMPLGMARAPAGGVLVAEMFNARVQELNPAGEWVRFIGAPGDRIGRFGRPKDVAAGPDGTIFVSDAASQRVHAFDAAGRPLLAFGEPAGNGLSHLLPGGIAVAEASPIDAGPLPDGFEAAYYVLVAEQLRVPGVRVYAWRKHAAGRMKPAGSFAARPAAPRVNAQGTRNPHGSAENCGACHNIETGSAAAIEPAAVDGLCLACHDGKQAHAEPHPIGRATGGPGINVPADWPLEDERLTCLTCHDVRAQCDSPGGDGFENAAMLRGAPVDSRLEFCANCHVMEQPWRVSPHRRAAQSDGVDQNGCMLCHTRIPESAPDGRRRFEPALSDPTPQLCLRCHAPHWNYAPQGHVGQTVTDKILAKMRAAERDAGDLTDGGASSATAWRPARLPLAEGQVACYTCHNPHVEGLFAQNTQVGSRASSDADRAIALRMDQSKLCLFCHTP